MNKETMKQLSKSRYTLFCQCPKALWLKTFKPEEAVVDASTETRFESGSEVGDLAMGLFGDFVEVTTKQSDGRLDLAAMVEKNRQEMSAHRGSDPLHAASDAWLSGTDSALETQGVRTMCNSSWQHACRRA